MPRRHRTPRIAACLSACLAGAAPALAQAPFPPQDAPPQGFVTMVGRGSAAATPDVASVRLTVTGEGQSFRQAFDAAAARAAAVVSALAAAGVPQSQVRSERFQALPARDAKEPGQGKDAAVQIRHTLVARVRGLARLGEVLERASAAGATEATVPELGATEEAAALQEARAGAARDAQDKARAYAAALGIPLGRIVSVAESPPRGREPRAEAPAGVDLARPDVRVEVTVVWEIAPGAPSTPSSP